MLLATGGALTSCGTRLRPGDEAFSADVISPMPQLSKQPRTGKVSRNNIDLVALPCGRFTPFPHRLMGTDTIQLCGSTGDIAALTRDPIRRVGPWQRAAGDRVEWTVTTTTGTLPTYKSYRVHFCAFAAWDPLFLKSFAIGRESQEYAVVVKNRSDERLEIIVDTDGADFWKNRKNAEHRPSSMVEPGATVRIRGFRHDCAEIAPFRFPATDSDGKRKTGSVSITVLSRSAHVDGIPANPEDFTSDP